LQCSSPAFAAAIGANIDVDDVINDDANSDSGDDDDDDFSQCARVSVVRFCLPLTLHCF
jgi:hypothetical protein